MDFRHEIDRKAFMAGTKIENAPASPVIAATRSKNLSALNPTNENQVVRLRDIEGLAVHFRLGNNNGFRQALCNGMCGVDNPYPFTLAAFMLAPAKIAGGTHEPSKQL